MSENLLNINNKPPSQPDFSDLSKFKNIKSLDELTSALNDINPYNKKLTEDSSFTCLSYTNFSERYLNYLKFISLKGFLYQCLKEYETLFLLERYSLETTEKHQKIILDFLDRVFKFNPTYHVAEEGLEPDKLAADMIYRWQQYEILNYDRLKKKVETEFNETNNFVLALQIHGSFTSLEDANKFVDEQKDTVPYSLYICPHSNWVTFESDSVNRENTTFVNDKNKLLGQLVDKFKRDEKMGQMIMEKKCDIVKILNSKIDSQTLDSETLKEIRNLEQTHKRVDFFNVTEKNIENQPILTSADVVGEYHKLETNLN